MEWKKLQQVKNYVDSPDPGIKAILINSANSGYADEIERILTSGIVDSSDAFSVDNFEGKNLSEDVFMASLNTMSLMMNRRIVRIHGSGKNTVDLIKKMLADYNGDTLVIVKLSSYQGKKMAIVKLFASDERLAVFSSYNVNDSDMASMISEIVVKCGKNIAGNALNWLIRNNDADYMTARSEIEKIITYAWDKSTITLEDVLSVSEDNADVDMQKLVDAVFNSDINSAGKIMTKLQMEAKSVAEFVNRVIFSISSYVEKLKLGKEMLDNGDRIESITRGVFIPAEVFASRHLNMWSRKNLDLISNEMLQLEKLSRSSSVLPMDIITERILFKIASLKTNG